MKIILHFLFALFILSGCSNANSESLSTNVEIDFSALEPFLLGEDLSKTFSNKTKAFSFHGKQKVHKEITKEAFIYISSETPTALYNNLSQWFDNKFKPAQQNERFNSWQNNTNEYLLYKQADSTIFVNIYKKTYK